MTDYSVEELVAALENGLFSTNSYVWDVNEEAEGVTPAGTAVPFSDAPWEDKNVEVMDYTASMTPEEKAGWDEFVNVGLDELVAEAENMLEELTASLENGGSLEDYGDPGDYEDYGDYESYGDSEDYSDDGVMEGRVTGDWPEHELAQSVPRPDFSVVMTTEDDYGFTTVFEAVSMEQAKAYVEQLKGAGFIEDAETYQEEVYGTTIYTYSAYDTAGVFAQLTFTDYSCTLSITR